ncbi:MAG: hypothetical protein IJO80_03980 [Firmicutes bacterium]|nr:hypothetical protein [Bacillota bacterium]
MELVKEKADTYQLMQLAQEIDEQYRLGREQLQRSGLLRAWREAEEMRSGRQWAPATGRTRHLPRPVFNIVDLIINHKTAQLLSDDLRLTYTAAVDDAPTRNAALVCSEQAEVVWQNTELARLTEQVVENAATFGCGIWHFFWDLHSGAEARYGGGIGGESLDPADCIFGNPQQSDVQKQPYIIICGKAPYGSIRAKMQQNGIPAALQPAYDEDEALLTLLTVYRREADGCISYAQITNGRPVTPWTPTYLQRYPLEVFCWKPRKHSIYGMGEVEGIIPNQKALNFIMAMMMLSVQDTAWPKIIAKPGALNQQLTNIPGEVVVDNYTGGEGIRVLQGQPLPDSALTLVDSIYDMTRNVCGANQVSTGELWQANLSGTAIVALQKAAAMPIDQVRRRLYRSLVNIGRIWEDFFKNKYLLARPRKSGGSFIGAELADAALSVSVDVSGGSDYAQALMMTNIENFLKAGYISFEEALEFMPDAAVPFKGELLRRIRAAKTAEA